MKNIINNEKITVNLDNEYYLKYLDRKDKQKKPLKKGYKIMIFIFVTAILFLIGGLSLIDLIFPEEPNNTIFTPRGDIILGNLPVPMNLVYFMIVAIGISWILHGFGFIIFRG